MSTEQKIGIFYEHPVWFEPMFRELERRNVPFDRLFAPEHSFDPRQASSPYRLIVNRMSPSAFTRGHGHAIPYTLEYLSYLQEIGADVMNGLDAYQYEFSKAKQLRLLARLGIRHPRARVINNPSQALRAAQDLRYPVLIKPNVGGSGAGIRRFETPEELQGAVESGVIDLGLDHIGLVQEALTPRDAQIVRVEVLDSEFLYAIKLKLESSTSFNLCPADYCRVPQPDEGTSTVGSSDSWNLVEGYRPPQEAIDTVLRLTKAAGIEVGGVEYLIDDRDGEIYYYDVNALSNFVADAPNVVGFDPFPKLVDYIVKRAGIRAAAPA